VVRFSQSIYPKSLLTIHVQFPLCLIVFSWLRLVLEVYGERRRIYVFFSVQSFLCGVYVNIDGGHRRCCWVLSEWCLVYVLNRHLFISSSWFGSSHQAWRTAVFCLWATFSLSCPIVSSFHPEEKKKKTIASSLRSQLFDSPKSQIALVLGRLAMCARSQAPRTDHWRRQL
jgi:hypothetical protein